MPFPLNELQNKLGYKFENIQLLHEALTHDFDKKNPDWDVFGDGNVLHKKRKMHRLNCVGVCVLNLLIAEKAIIVHHENNENDLSEEITLTNICRSFDDECDYCVVGYKLRLWEYIHTRDSNNLKNPTIHKHVIQAIFGAVFIDEGGCEGESSSALNSVRKLFDLILNKLYVCGKIYPRSEELQRCFQVHHCDAKTYLLSKNYVSNIKPYNSLEKKIGYIFNEPNLIKAALTHKSVKTFIDNLLDNEALGFIGDAVYELVMCEYLFWNYINDMDGKVFNFETLKKFVSKEFQCVLARCLKLENFLVKPDCVKLTEIQKFLGSIIGAIYVDGKSLVPVKNLAVELCRRFEKETIENCDTRLPCTWLTYYGSWHYRQKESLESKITEEHRQPPKRQEVFKIMNFKKLDELLGKYYGPYNMGGFIQSYLSRANVAGTESWCNQQEFGRISLYQTMIRIWHLANIIYDYNTGEMSRSYIQSSKKRILPQDN